MHTLEAFGAASCKKLHVSLAHIRDMSAVSPVMLRAAKQQRRKRARAEDSDAEEDVAATVSEREGSRLQPLVSCVCMTTEHGRHAQVFAVAYG